MRPRDAPHHMEMKMTDKERREHIRRERFLPKNPENWALDERKRRERDGEGGVGFIWIPLFPR